LEDRLARWLLQALDLIDERELPLTQESLAKMLGVRRTSVTLIANRLQADGLIRYRRGHIVVLNRAGLEDVACECYRAIRQRNARHTSSSRQSVSLSLGDAVV
jgi:Mn-dependent DtxR family transcriptional regulator